MYIMSEAIKNSIYFIYARKSSEGEDRQVQSIDDQINRLTEMATAQGLKIKQVFTEAKTAKKPYCRPVFAEMLKRIEKGEADGVLCWKLDRLARNPVDAGAITWMLQNNIITQIKTIDRCFYPSDNVLMMSVEFGMANQYIIDMKKNIMRGMDSKAEKGFKPGMAPLGYINDKSGKVIIPDPDRFDVVRKMWDMMLTGNFAPQQIRRVANTEWGFRTLQRRGSGGNQIPMSGIYTLFGNIFYTGMFRWKGKLYKGNHRPMVSPEEFDRVQELLGRKCNKRPQTHNFAYTGHIKCLYCNMMYTATEKRKVLKTTGAYLSYSYYHCSRKNKQIKCTNSPVSLKELEDQISEELDTVTILPCFLEWATGYLDSESAKSTFDYSKSIEMKQKSLELAERELVNLTRMRYRDLIDDITFERESLLLKDKITKIGAGAENIVEKVKNSYTLAKSAFHFSAYARLAFKNGTFDEKRAVFNALGSNYGIKDKKLIFKTAFWLVPIKIAYKDLLDEFNRLELQKNLDKSTWDSLLSPIILKWCSITEDVRKAIEANNVNINIPNLQEPALHRKNLTNNSPPSEP